MCNDFEERCDFLNRGNSTANNLIKETSPYLKQHAYNPVPWYPWGEEAFQKAREEDKLIFLSIGYSTCHWCHVMAEESFEDEEVAGILKEHYISIKVDREERPDVDAVYMSVCQVVNGQGGWPLTIIMTPEQKPVFAGTYLPKRHKYGTYGLIELLLAYAKGWKEKKHRFEEEADRITAYLYESSRMCSGHMEPTKELLREAALQFQDHFDRAYGGFGGAPKFPCPHQLLFLMKYAEFENREDILDMVFRTLDGMYRGGIFDHVGGGFSRYSTDDMWLVPHFEKMLYDNALLSYVYMEAYQISGDMLYREISERTLQYMLAELKSVNGAFYCGQDADSDGVEGKYYVFTVNEVKEVLGEEKGRMFAEWFGMTAHGNFEGANILNLLSNENYRRPNPQMEALCKELITYRKERCFLHRDEKRLLSWNALAVVAFAKAYQILGEELYLREAQGTMEYIEECLGKAFILDEFSYTVWAYLELYRAGYDVMYLKKACELAEETYRSFQDKENGGFFFYSSEAEQLISRPKEVYDGALPSGNGVFGYVLVQLEHITGEVRWAVRAEEQLLFLTKQLKNYPMGYSAALLAVAEEIYAYRTLVCVGENMEKLEEVDALIRKRWSRNLIVLKKTKENEMELKEVCPYTESYPIREKAGYYLCQDGACLPPVEELEKLRELLEKE